MYGYLWTAIQPGTVLGAEYSMKNKVHVFQAEMEMMGCTDSSWGPCRYNGHTVMQPRMLAVLT